MGLKNKAKLIIYRFQEKGLEVFLVNSDKDGENWVFPDGVVAEEKPKQLVETDELIELDPVKQDDGKQEEAWAIEGDWHDIPSLKNMLYEDAIFIKDKVKEMEKGAFFAVKEAFKKVLPHQYEFLKELKDILVDRNSLKNM